MFVAEILKRMLCYCDGSLHDINHFLRVYAYARTIGQLEGLDDETQETLEIAAILHDIACPLCREKYGSVKAEYQEYEGGILARAFLEEAGAPPKLLERVVFLVSHHHTVSAIDGPDFQILVEADYLLNAGDSGYSRENIKNTLEKVFKTAAGREMLRAIYKV